MIRVVQVGIVVGMVFLYVHMLRLRSRALSAPRTDKQKDRSKKN